MLLCHLQQHGPCWAKSYKGHQFLLPLTLAVFISSAGCTLTRTPAQRSLETPSPLETLDQYSSKSKPATQAKKPDAESSPGDIATVPTPQTFGSDSWQGSSVVVQAPTLQEQDRLLKSFMRYIKNIVATEKIFSANLSTRDEQVIEYYIEQSPDARTPKEQAILFLALLEHAVVEYDHLLQNTPAHGGGAITQSLLPKLSNDYRVQILTELKRNPHLEDPLVYHFVFLVLAHVDTPERFLSPLVLQLKEESKKWAALHESLTLYEERDSGVFTPVPGVGVQEAVSEALSQQQDPADKNFSAGEFSEADKFLRLAKQLHTERRYGEALEQLDAISPQSPYYGTAQDLRAEYSDDAVSVLRSEAAQLFQDHFKIPAVTTKIEYLQDAESKLQTALASYPQSQWLPKVRNNLDVIQEHLERYQNILHTQMKTRSVEEEVKPVSESEKTEAETPTTSEEAAPTGDSDAT